MMYIVTSPFDRLWFHTCYNAILYDVYNVVVTSRLSLKRGRVGVKVRSAAARRLGTARSPGPLRRLHAVGCAFHIPALQVRHLLHVHPDDVVQVPVFPLASGLGVGVGFSSLGLSLLLSEQLGKF